MISCMESMWLGSVVVCLEAVVRSLSLGMEKNFGGGGVLTGENTDKWRKILQTIRMIP